MNQAISFPEREWWDESLQAVCFSAQVSGFPLTCAISGQALLQRYPGEPEALHCFSRHRWDIEEEAERLIKAGAEDSQGWVWLCSAR